MSTCERYGQEGKVDYLEGLLEATRDLSHIDRSEVFQQLLNTYIREGNPEKALGLWTLLQEESVVPTDKFLIDLSEFLKLQNIDVPFVIPEVVPVVSPRPSPRTSKPSNENIPIQQKPKPVSDSQERFASILNSGDIDAALSYKENVGKLTRKNVSDLIEKLINANLLSKAVEVVIAELKGNTFPVPKVVRFLLNTLANQGKTEEIARIGDHLTPEQKRMISFDNRKCNAFVSAGDSSDFLEKLSLQISSARDEDLPLLKQSFPKGGIIGLLSSEPSCLPRFAEIAEKFAQRGILDAVNILWMHHFISGEDEKAKELWSEHLSTSQTVMFRKIMKEAEERKDTGLITKLLSTLNSVTNVNHSALGVVYSRQIDILVDTNKPEEAIRTIEAALSNGCSLEHINKTSLERCKKAVEKDGGQFAYDISNLKKYKSKTKLID